MGKVELKKGIKELETNQHMISEGGIQLCKGTAKHWEPYIDPDLSLPHSHPLSFLLPLPLELLFGFEILGSCVFCFQERLGWL